jgi:hypothetical protein
MISFEETLSGMTKPGIPELKHQTLLAEAISRGRSKSVLSLWWVSIPLYVTAMLLMKSLYVHDTTLITNLHEFIGREKYAAALFFLIAPAVFIIMNAASIRRIHYLSGSPGFAALLRTAWFNAAIIVVSFTILFIYFS